MIIRACFGPPNSAAILGLKRRYISTPMQIKASIQNISTEKPNEPGSTLKLFPSVA